MRGIICLSTLEWDHIWNRPHELMSRFARMGARVAFVEPLGIREPQWQDWPRVVGRLRQAVGGAPRTARPAPPLPAGLQRVAPLVLPFHGRPWAHALNRQLLRRLAQRLVAWTGPEPLIWSYYATEMVLALRAALPGSPTVFDCMDEIALNHKGVARNYRESEAALIRAAEVTFVSSQALFEAKAPLSPRVRLVSHGANVEPFLAPPGATPVAFAHLPHPRLLFFGGLDERLDQPLLAALAEARPGWQFILVGPRKVPLDTLAGRPNVHILGPQAHSELPATLAAADVLLIPYRLDPYTRFIYPTKIHECLASGRPTVATPLPDLRPLAPLVSLAEGMEGWLAAIEGALSPEAQRAEVVAARRAVASTHSWSQRFGAIWEAVGPLLAPERREVAHV